MCPLAIKCCEKLRAFINKIVCKIKCDSKC